MPPFWYFFSDGQIEVFAVFLMGVLGKVGFWLWFFCGEFVVECVFIVDRRHQVAWSLKTCHGFEIYFRVRCGNGEGDPILGTDTPKVGSGLDSLRRFPDCLVIVGDGFEDLREDYCHARVDDGCWFYCDSDCAVSYRDAARR